MSLLRVRKLLMAMTNLIGTGFAVGLSSLTNFEFKPDKPFRACLICGDVYQTEADRDNNPLAAINGKRGLIVTLRRIQIENIECLC
jgi:hypothetical protein